MQAEVITRRDDLIIRRLVLEPGEAMPWHTDACHRFSVIVRGQQLTPEFREAGERMKVAVHPGMVDWDEPDARVHRAVNTGATTYEEVVTFLLTIPGLDPSQRLLASDASWCGIRPTVPGHGFLCCVWPGTAGQNPFNELSRHATSVAPVSDS